MLFVFPSKSCTELCLNMFEYYRAYCFIVKSFIANSQNGDLFLSNIQSV